MRILTVFGTRPEAVKMAPLVKKLEEEPSMQSVLCVTGQHREMLDQVLEAFSLEPDFDLAIMEEGQTLASVTAKVLERTLPVIQEAQPDLVLVHGDTTTSVSTALGAFYERIPVGHVEAGLRSHDRYSPFPEEMNRKMLSALATYHFAPTKGNADALRREGIDRNIWITGNTVLDAFAYTMRDDYRFACSELNRIDFDRPTVLVTAHRRENIGLPLENICSAVLHLASCEPAVQFIYPVHLNPSVRDLVYHALGGQKHVFLLEPIDIIDMHNLMARCAFVMTDSGGLQEEAPFLDKPVLVLRRETEREEVIEAGAAVLVGTETKDIVREASRLLDDAAHYRTMALAPCPYGDGHASERILKHLITIAEESHDRA